ncbi:MAG: STAS domain-containing protein [Alphaproteobacteria bacterium]|nr:STAS domain-containing protein [Alphaproteobacteria bacterium]
MEIDKTIQDGITVLNIKGRLISATSTALEERINAEMDIDNKLILNFAGVDFMASSGIRTLLAATKRAQAEEGVLILVNVSPTVLNVLEMTGLRKFLDIR